MSNTERAILNAVHPIKLNLNEEIEVSGVRGLWLNKDEVLEWRGDGHLSIEDYPLNVDVSPQIINKKVHTPLKYIQELAIRYLRPPTPYGFLVLRLVY